MELAHLDLVLWEGVEQAAHPVDDNSLDDVAHARYRLHGFHVVGYGLMLDERHVERTACGIVQGKQHALVAPPVGHVKVDEPAPPVKAGCSHLMSIPRSLRLMVEGLFPVMEAISPTVCLPAW